MTRIQTVGSNPSIPCPSVRLKLSSSGRFLLLVIDKLDIILGYNLVLVQEELLDFVTDIALDDNLLASAGQLGDRGARSELLAEFLGHLLELEPECFQSRDGRDVLALVALNPLDCHDAVGFLVCFLLVCLLGLGRLLLRVLGGALLGRDGEVCRSGF